MLREQSERMKWAVVMLEFAPICIFLVISPPYSMMEMDYLGLAKFSNYGATWFYEVNKPIKEMLLVSWLLIKRNSHFSR